MLNAKSVALQIIEEFSDEWVEEFFGSKEWLISDLASLINQFEGIEEIDESDEFDFLIPQLGGGLYSFQKEIRKAYGL